MDAVSQLIIAALFALHQYLPANTQATKYFDYVADPVTLAPNYNSLTILAAAHQTCRHLFVAGSKELNLSEQELVNLAFTAIDDQKNKFLEVQTSSERTKDIITRLCQADFDPQSFSRTEAKQVEQFINSKIAVLTQKDLDSTGAYRFFGRVELYDRNGSAMGPLFSSTEHWIPYSEISPLMVNALVGAEDDHFFKHDGVYLGSLTRMAYGMTASSDSEITGGSTLTMQLLKNLYFANWPEAADSVYEQKSKMKTMLRKVREWYWAKIYEKYHEKLGPGSGKRFVLENYLNLMDYGPGIRGIDQASQVFFKKSPAQLDLADAAFMASMFKGPSRYARPGNYATYTEGRRAYVLKRMGELSVSENGFAPIKAKDKAAALAVPLPQWQTSGTDEATQDESAGYLRSYAREFISRDVEIPAATRVIEAELKSTIDQNLQKVVFDAVRNRLDDYDARRDKLSRVGAARDDRSQVATAIADDISADINGALMELKKAFTDLHLNVRLAVYLGNDGEDRDHHSFYEPSPEILPAKPQAEQNELMNQSARFVGQLILTELAPERCPELNLTGKFRSLQSAMSPLLPDAVSSEPTGLPVEGSDEAASEDVFTLPGFPVLPPDEDVSGAAAVPLPRKRPDNADELIARMQKKIRENLYLGLPVQLRPETSVPFAPDLPGACVHSVGAQELAGLGLSELFHKTQDTVSKRLVRSLLLRMEALAPRPDMLPALYDGRDAQSPLVIAPAAMPEDSLAEYSQWVRPVRLTTKSGNHEAYVGKAIQRGRLKVGQILWVRAEEKQKGVFRLAAPKLQAAVVVMDSETGDVLANFGGYSPGSSKFFDRSRLAARQPGSTLKPWLYYLALNKGFEPFDQIQNEGVVFDVRDQKPFIPDNFSSGEGGYAVSVQDAFIHSLNKAAVGLLTNPRFGPDPMGNLQEFHDFLVGLGLYAPDELPVVPSIALGSQGLSILDLVSSLTFFANGKHVAKPRFFTSFNNGQGRSLYKSQPQFQDVPFSDHAISLFQMQTMLLQVANSGTAAGLRNFTLNTMKLSQCDGGSLGLSGQICFGGKTGTSSDSKDNWFMGISRRFVIGIWVGYDFPESTDATGGQLAVPVFQDIVRKGRKYLPPIEPLVDQAPAGLNLVYVGKEGNCQTADHSGTPVYTRQDPTYIPVCIDCSCQEVGSNGYETVYTLMINGIPNYDTSFGYYDYFTYDRCQQEKSWRCGL